MKKDKYRIRVSFSLYKYGQNLPHPRDIEPPKGAVKEAWIPQSIVDRIWIIYKFENPKYQKEFLNNPPEVFQKALIRQEDRKFYEHWLG